MKLYKQLNSDYTTIPNEIYRHGLSLKAIGLYTYIINKPDGWEFSLSGVSAQVKDGVDSIRSGISELEEAGFLQTKRGREDGGKYGKSIWIIADKPIWEIPILEKPMLDKPMLDNPPQVNTNKVNTNLSKNNLSKKESKKKKSLFQLDDTDFTSIAESYNVPISFVRSKYEDLQNYCKANGKRYKDYKAALRNFVKKDALQIRQEAQREQRNRSKISEVAIQ